ncbi:MAG TPA: chemotaxis-specific protein-glutamate methyltransferase CheB [Burkholderiales bacterium]|nr:chemotaxis-specific protein-glutamate methyltransferase CheB [Burkholderiales bacterium]
MKRIRVLVVEDSITVRERLCAVLSAAADIEVVGEAMDGAQAIEQCTALRPDVMTLDMVMPVMSGLAATEYIMAHCPTPILIVSASTNRGELYKTYDALAAGALDAMEKPLGDEADDDWELRLVSAVRLLSKIKVITHPRPRMRTETPAPRRYRVVAIGASTGGPGAVVEVLRAIPAGFTLPILLVMHVSEPFAAALAEWLNDQSPHVVRVAREGAVLSMSGVTLAPAGRHLVVEHGKLRFSDAPERHSCRPSIDVLFESVALEYRSAAAACLLTGMGRDGAAGLLQIRRAGGLTIAQDEASCVVYGMPREAVLLDAAERVLPLAQIGTVVAGLAGDGRGDARA